jgi:predicted acylesterase/phospholipase RssA
MSLFTVACATPPASTTEKPWESNATSTPVKPPDRVVPEYPKTVGESQAVKERPKITLVLGGAGVASFATIGILKRLHEARLRPDLIVCTGWPSLFVLAYGFFPSIHEAEWFASRLTEKDFYKASLFDFEKGYASHEKLSKLVENAFKQREIQAASVPIVISTTNTEFADSEIFDRGDWREPLLRTMSVPGLFRPYPSDADRPSISSLQGLDIDEAVRRGAGIVVAVYMYDDYLRMMSKSGKNADALFRKIYQAQLRKGLGLQLARAQIRASIEIFKDPNDFSARRSAILVGYKEAARLVEEIRNSIGR